MDVCFSRSVGEHNHFAVNDLILGNKLRSSFRIDLDLRVRESFLDRADSRVLVGDGDKDEFPARRSAGASTGPHGADFPTFDHGSV
ncbi:hypothetical protein Nwi_0758 [Nitrobacter winogradskyi Nb-255]|uniref:Uncharacterized protein n=1 Tax=Nitrobacter winogradskyi (strain ATCC 25391 / DSM 10237 / CIP 104748 / NCIMB 11846 / Nb-255) TaxID=323098 RepID=Q3SUL8_NITWN|nr:hypothetical protein Nwi_0758 [Nitrobacter winogradskyi Nb-255]